MYRSYSNGNDYQSGASKRSAGRLRETGMPPTRWTMKTLASHMATELDYRISIENAVSALCKADKTADVAFVLQIFGHGAKSVEEVAPSDYEAVFSELHDRVRDMND